MEGGGEGYGGGCSCRTQVRRCASCGRRRRASLATPPACWPCSRPSRSRLTPNPSVSYSSGQVRACRETAAKPDEKGTPRPPRFDTGQGPQARAPRGQHAVAKDSPEQKQMMFPDFPLDSTGPPGSGLHARSSAEAGPRPARTAAIRVPARAASRPALADQNEPATKSLGRWPTVLAELAEFHCG